MEWLNFRHLYAFWMVARSGSFTRAAEQMHVVQSAVSAQVSALEEYAEEQLLIRTSRSVELTPAGRELMRFADTIFQQSRAINARIRDKDALGGRPTMRLGVVGGASRNFVYRLLEGYQEREPQVRVSVSSGSYEELYALLRKFELDAIITLEPPRKKDMIDVSYQKLGESKMCVVAPPRLLADIRAGRVEEVEVYKFRHPVEADVLERHVRPAVACSLVLRMDTDDVPLLRFFANSGKGVAVLPRVGVLEDLDAGKVEAIELPRCPEVTVYGITMHEGEAPLGREHLRGLWP